MPEASLQPHEIAEAVLAKPKYHTIAPQLVQTLAEGESVKGRKAKDAIKEVSAKLHQVGTAYMGSSPDYSMWLTELAALPVDPHAESLRAFCQRCMGAHASTRERLQQLDTFFTKVLAPVVPLYSVLDLACGLNPLALPWLPLADGAAYEGYDIFSDMTAFGNSFLAHIGAPGAVHCGDILHTEFPRHAQAAFLLKTLPVLEQLEKGSAARLVDRLPTDVLLISYPVRSLGGRAKGMGRTYEQQFNDLADGRRWAVTRFELANELVFLVQR